MVFDPIKIVFHPNKNGVSPHSFHTFTSFQSICDNHRRLSSQFLQSRTDERPPRSDHVPCGQGVPWFRWRLQAIPQAGQLTWMGETHGFPIGK
jgi:hypothetical protein